MKTINALLAVLVLALGTTQLSCNVNDYCLNCGTDDAGPGTDDANDANDDIDAEVDAATCVPTGTEECDGEDNDCNGLVDDGVLPMVDDPCDNTVGACAGGTKICQNGALRCTKMPSPEVCDGIDNNCNGMEDEGDPGGGGICGTSQGECQAGQLRCQASAGCITAANCDPLTQNCCVVCTNFVDRRNDPETCDGQDDDCDGSFDEGLTNLGACTWQGATNNGACNIGTMMCEGGNPVCKDAVYPQFETCNNADDDCDNSTDEIFNKVSDPTNCGTCGTVCPATAKTCVGGPTPRAVCTTDANCGTGGTCQVNSQPCCGPGCAPSKPSQTNGTCNFECNVGFLDLNGTASDGCEYKCSPTGNEECDGADNDCDGLVDEPNTAGAGQPANGIVVPVGLCLSQGVCSGTAPMCMAAQGWKCNYPATAEFPEVSCDNLNNDCDGNIDESHPTKFQTCYDTEPSGTAQQGICRDQGALHCNAADPDGPLICARSENGAMCTNSTDDNGDGRVNDGCPAFGTAETSCTDTVDNDGDGRINDGCPSSTLPDTQGTTESCNAKDDDCDGTTDETTSGNLAGVEWVSIGNGKQMMKYEASKPDATAADQGITTTITNSNVTRTQVCSRPGVQPWTNISYPQAKAACEAIGASLCTEAQWHSTCSVVAQPTYPLSVTTASSTIIEAENYFAIAHGPAAAGAETVCSGAVAVDEDGDGYPNDGCAAVSSAETSCLDTTDSDSDGTANDGCPVVNTPQHAWVADYTAGYSGIAAMEATPNTFLGGISSANATTLAPRLDYQLSMAAGTYRVQLKMFQTGIAGNNDVAYVRLSPVSAALTTVTLPATIACTQDSTCSTAAGYTNGKCVDGNFNGTVDSCSGWRWVDAGTSYAVGATTQTLSVFMGDDGVKIDKVAITQTSTAPADTATGSGNVWAYATNASTYQPTTCNGQDFSSANDNLVATGSLTSCFAATGSGVFDMSGNVKEWALAQAPGQNPIRGGASNSTAAGISCALNFTLADDAFLFPNIGFRCCK